MDKDYSYQKALKKTLKEDKRWNKKKLEKNLNNYCPYRPELVKHGTAQHGNS